MRLLGIPVFLLGCVMIGLYAHVADKYTTRVSWFVYGALIPIVILWFGGALFCLIAGGAMVAGMLFN